jgi:hypothetical protein
MRCFCPHEHAVFRKIVIHFPWKVREGLSVEFVLWSEHLLAANDNAPKQTKSHQVIIRQSLTSYLLSNMYRYVISIFRDPLFLPLNRY